MLLPIFLVITNALAGNSAPITDSYLSGLWQCSSQGTYPDGMVVKVTGNVVHRSDVHQYEYSGKVLSYYVSNPQQYSQLTLQLVGHYVLDGNEMWNKSESVSIESGADGLDMHTEEFLSGFSDNLKKPVVAILTPISNKKFKSVVIETGETSLCQRSEGIEVYGD